MALGDVVETDADRSFVRVVESSGRYVFRVWFGEAVHRRGPVADELVELGALVEWSSENLLAVDAADAARAQVVADYLAEQEAARGVIYEAGRSA